MFVKLKLYNADMLSMKVMLISVPTISWNILNNLFAVLDTVIITSLRFFSLDIHVFFFL